MKNTFYKNIIGKLKRELADVTKQLAHLKDQSQENRLLRIRLRKQEIKLELYQSRLQKTSYKELVSGAEEIDRSDRHTHPYDTVLASINNRLNHFSTPDQARNRGAAKSYQHVIASGDTDEVIRDKKIPEISGNDWVKLSSDNIEDFEPSVKCSVVIPCYNDQSALAITLQWLANQTYPKKLIEIVIVDDGSDVPVRPPDNWVGPSITIVRQERRGFRLAEARNLGAISASGEILLFLDADMIPQSDWVKGHAAWHHSYPLAITTGRRFHLSRAEIKTPENSSSLEDSKKVFQNMLSNNQCISVKWIDKIIEESDLLTDDLPHIFGIFCGGNLGIAKTTFKRVGGFRSTFRAWGAEDTEFCSRLYTAGTLFIPAINCTCIHQGEGGVDGPMGAEVESLTEQRELLTTYSPYSLARNQNPPLLYAVPKLVIDIYPGFEPVSQVDETIQSLLRSHSSDFRIRLFYDDGDTANGFLNNKYFSDPRIVFADDIPEEDEHAAFYAIIAPFVRIGPSGIKNMLKFLEVSNVGGLLVTDMFSALPVVTLYRQRAINRALISVQDPGEIPEKVNDLYGVASFDGSEFGVELIRNAHIYPPYFVEKKTTPHTELRFNACGNTAKTLCAALGVEHTATQSLSDLENMGIDSTGKGVVIDKLLLDRDYDSNQLTSTFSNRGLKPVVLFDELGTEAGSRPAAIAVMHLSEVVECESTSLPEPKRFCLPFNEKVFSPDYEDQGSNTGQVAICLFNILPGVAEILSTITDNNLFTYCLFVPEKHLEMMSDIAGDAPVRVLPDDEFAMVNLMKRYSCVLDHQIFHTSTGARATWIVRLSAVGAVVRMLDNDETISDLVSPELIKAAKNQALEDVFDPARRRILARTLVRESHRFHSAMGFQHNFLVDLGIENRSYPLISILAVTNRPDYLTHFIDQIRQQSYSNIEVNLVCHGRHDDFTSQLNQIDIPDYVNIRSVSDRHCFGYCLNIATAMSSGEFVTKMDDDDWYYKNHLFDLYIAKQSSDADLIGKTAEFIYIQQDNITLQRAVTPTNGQVSGYLAGGTLFLRRSLLDELGGWSLVEREVDRQLIEDVVDADKTLYRCDSLGYVLHRHQSGHTWDVDSSFFAKGAKKVYKGLQLEKAGFEL